MRPHEDSVGNSTPGGGELLVATPLFMPTLPENVDFTNLTEA